MSWKSNSQSRDTGSDYWFHKLKSVVFPLLPICPRRPKDRVKVAIISTGIDMTDSFISFHRERIHARSFLPGIDSIEDTDGHGTHSAALLLRIAQNADIYVARVSRGGGDTTADRITEV